MARRRYGKRRHSASKKIPIAATLGLLAPMANDIMKNGFTAGGLNAVVGHYTGYSMVENTWKAEYLMKGLVPAAAGMMVSAGASKFGLNRRLPKWVPFKL